MAAVLSPPEETPGVFFPHEVNNSKEAIMDNVRRNAARGLPELTQRPWTDVPLMVVAGGPSVHDYLDVIRALSGECHILAVNGAYKFLRTNGIECDYFVMIDSREGNLVHVDSPGEGTHHLLASQVHPRVFDALNGHHVSLFHLGTEATVEALGDPPDQEYLTAPIGMASVHAIYVAAGLGYRSMMLFGYDFSQRERQPYAYEQLMNLSDDVIDIPLNGKIFRTTLSLARTADQFVQAISPVIRGCELAIQVYAEGLLPELLRAHSVIPSKESEQAKYERMWQVEAYRKVSPGLADVEDAVTRLGIPAGARVADFGCGTGRVVRRLRDLGFDAVGVDIASNCLEESVPFVQSALWEVENLPKVEYGLSCDVLEHIPTEKVADTLKAIRDSVSVSCYLNIDTIPDSFGLHIGQRLHLTVKPAWWWADVLEDYWPSVELIRDDGRQAVFICKR